VPAKRPPAPPPAPAPAPPVVQGFSPDVGPAGTALTIRGKFADDVVVLIGRHEVKPSSRTRGSITITVPRNIRPGSHRLVVKSAGGEASIGSFRLVGAEPPPVAVAPPPPPPPGPPPGTRRPPPRRIVAPTVSNFRPRQGPAGTTVTIRGRNFTPQLQVFLGGQEVEARVTPTSITFEVPRRVKGTEPIVLRGHGRRDLVVGSFEVASRRADRRAERAARKAEAEAAWKAQQKKIPKAVPDRRAALLAYEEELRRTREERRMQRLAEIQAAWERAFLSSYEVQTELQLHAERRARLGRMLRLAEADNHGQLVVRIRVLIKTEDVRHERRMADLRAAFQG
jgi:hypothetical protein